MKTERNVTRRGADGKIQSIQYLVDGKPVPQGYKYCPACQQILELSLFSSRGNACKECAKARARAWYEEAKQNPDWIKKRNERVTKDGVEKKKRAIAFLGGKCQDCGGVFHPAVFDFHHLDPSQKEHNLGNILRRKDFSSIEKELTKCVLLCANCHRLRHFEGGKNESAT